MRSVRVSYKEFQNTMIRGIKSIRFQLKPFVNVYRQFFDKFSLPDFLIIGAQKCGTSSLYSYLIQHPGIITAGRKEIHFFGNPNNLMRGKSWYASQFPTISYKESLRKKLDYLPITGEATPDMHMPFMPQSVHQLLPSVKIIVMFRDPVDRAFSQYQHDRRISGREPLTFKEAIAQSSWKISPAMQDAWMYAGNRNNQLSYIRRGLYAEQLERWYTYYPKDGIHIIHSEEFFADPAPILKKVLQFLNMPDYEFDTSIAKNVGNYKEQMDKDVKEHLVSNFRPHNRRLYELIGCDFGWPA